MRGWLTALGSVQALRENTLDRKQRKSNSYELGVKGTADVQMCSIHGEMRLCTYDDPSARPHLAMQERNRGPLGDHTFAWTPRPGGGASSTYRLPTGSGGKHLPDAGRPAHNPGAVAEHKDQLIYVLRSKGPVFTSWQGNQFSPFSDWS